MDRLVCGDVGYGKTEVALRAIFRAVQGGKQACILAPTTVLVEQHFRTLSERYQGFAVNLGKLSRFQTKGEQIATIKKLADGQLDVVVGTHRALSADVRFKDLGLLVIDEEQRFGVAHKEKIKKTRTQIDVLTLTATPIPRTLHLAMANLRDLSIIATPPADRRAVRTAAAARCSSSRPRLASPGRSHARELALARVAARSRITGCPMRGGALPALPVGRAAAPGATRARSAGPRRATTIAASTSGPRTSRASSRRPGSGSATAACRRRSSRR
jgi:hypothetical protein